MARYRKIDPRIWNDEKFRTMTHESQRLFLFVLTHPSLTMIGAMRATRAGLSEELGLDAKAFREAFGEALSKGMLKYDEKAFLLWLPNFLKYNSPESPNVVKSWDSALDLLPECDLRNEVLSSAKSYISTMSKAFAEALPKAFTEAFEKPMPKAMPKTMPNQEQEQYIKEVKEEKSSFPSQAIVDEFNKTCTFCPKVQTVSASRRTALKARAEEMKKLWKSDDALANFKRYFGIIASSKFLRNETTKGEGHQNFQTSFDWFLKESNFSKIVEGNYSDNKNNSASPKAEENIFSVNRMKRIDEARKRMYRAEEPIPDFFTEAVANMGTAQ